MKDVNYRQVLLYLLRHKSRVKKNSFTYLYTVIYGLLFNQHHQHGVRRQQVFRCHKSRVKKTHLHKKYLLWWILHFTNRHVKTNILWQLLTTSLYSFSAWISASVVCVWSIMACSALVMLADLMRYSLDNLLESGSCKKVK